MLLIQAFAYPDKKCIHYQDIFFSYFATETYVVGIH